MTTLIMTAHHWWAQCRRAIDTFFFTPASALPLALFRIGLALVLIWQAILMRTSFLRFFAKNGFVQIEVSNQLSDPLAPRLDWLVNPITALGINEHIVLYSLAGLYIASLLFLLGGLYTRWAAFFAWFLHWSFLSTGYSGAYGADMYSHFFLFYLLIVPSGHALSLDRVLGRVTGEPSYQARVGLRVLQLHMCISYLASGIEKASGAQWWNGEILWIALNTPGYSIGDFHWLAYAAILPMVGGWVVLAIEIFYCIMVWPKKTRLLWVIATCALHLGIAVFLKLPIFGVLMCVPTVALFGVSAEPSERTAQSRRAAAIALSTNEGCH